MKTMNMKQSVMTITLPIALLVLIGALQASAQDDQSCSNASLKGSYGFQITGSIPGVFAIGGVARVLFDGQGKSCEYCRPLEPPRTARLASTHLLQSPDMHCPLPVLPSTTVL